MEGGSIDSAIGSMVEKDLTPSLSQPSSIRRRGHKFRHHLVSTPIDAQNLTEPGDHDMLGHAQAKDTRQRSNPEQPEVQGDRGHQEQERRDAEL